MNVWRCLVLASALAVIACPLAAQGLGEDDPREPGDFGAPPPDHVEEPSPDPNLPGEPVPNFTSDEFQFVGFTHLTYTGDRGVLTYALACQERFPLSRMCTIEEINRTVIVPQPHAMSSHAWVQDNMTLPTDPASTNCNGWMSASPGNQGMAIDLGLRFGGCAFYSCSNSFAVACCAQSLN